MDRAEEAKIQRIQSIYNDFLLELEDLKKQHREVITAAVQKIDHQQIQDTLKSLHQS